MENTSSYHRSDEKIINFPQNFLPSPLAMYITVHNHEIINHSLHPGTLIANTFISKKFKYFYFEITVQNSERGPISVGLVSQAKFKGQPLGKKDGYGLRNDARLLSNGSPAGVEWSLARPWGAVGDTIGCGYIPETRELFYTQGSKYCGVAFKIPEIDNDMTPCLCLGPQREVKANFGGEDFVFNISEYIKSRDQLKVQELDQVPIALPNIQDMIREYLLVNGYGNTLHFYEKAIHRSQPIHIDATQSTSLTEESSTLKGVDGTRLSDGVEILPLVDRAEGNGFQNHSSIFRHDLVSLCNKDEVSGKQHSSQNEKDMHRESFHNSEDNDDDHEESGQHGHQSFLNGLVDLESTDHDEVMHGSGDFYSDHGNYDEDDRIHHYSEFIGDDDDDLMELEDEEDDDDEEEKVDIEEHVYLHPDDDEDDDEDEEQDHQDEESNEALAEQLHSALHELSQTHRNVLYINRVYGQSPPPDPAPRRRRSISASLSSIVSGIRRATDINPRRAEATSVPTHGRRIPGQRVLSLETEDEAKLDNHNSTTYPVVWRSSLKKQQSISAISIRSLFCHDGIHLKDEFVLRKTLAIRCQTRKLIKQKRYSDIIQLLSPITSYFNGFKFKFTSSPAWIYLQCLIFVENLSCGREEAAFDVASNELLPHLIYYTPEVSPKNNSHANKKRLRESHDEDDPHNSQYPTNSIHNASFLNKYFPSSQYSIIEKLIRDVISLFSINNYADNSCETKYLQSSTSSKLSSEDSIQSLYQYFESNEFLELISDTINIFLLHSVPNYYLPNHHTAIELCISHSMEMNSLSDDKRKSTLMKYLPSNLRREYEMYPVTWSNGYTKPPKGKKFKILTKNISEMEKQN